MKKENKITYLELLNLIKEGKQPDQVELEYDGLIYHWQDGNQYVYVDEYPGAVLLIEEVAKNCFEIDVVKEKMIKVIE